MGKAIVIKGADFSEFAVGKITFNDINIRVLSNETTIFPSPVPEGTIRANWEKPYLTAEGRYRLYEVTLEKDTEYSVSGFKFGSNGVSPMILVNSDYICIRDVLGTLGQATTPPSTGYDDPVLFDDFVIDTTGLSDGIKLVFGNNYVIENLPTINKL